MEHDTLPDGYKIKVLWDGDCYSYHLYRGDTKIAADWVGINLYKVAQEDAKKQSRQF